MITFLKWIYKYIKMKQRGIKLTFKSARNATLNGAIYGKNIGLYDVEYISKGTEIGDYSYMNKGSMLLSGKIGRFCSIGYNVIISPNEHPIDSLITHPISYKSESKENNNRLKNKKETIIEDNVWVGANAIIMKGVTIGEGSVIGANAVVTKDIPAYSIAVGVPARVIKNRKDYFNIEDIDIKNMKTEEIISYINCLQCGDKLGKEKKND